MRRILIAILVLVLSGCSSGYTQDEVDALVSDAVETAVSEQSDLISEEEAQAQADAAIKQASLLAAVEKEECGVGSTESRNYIFVDEGGLVMEGKGDESAGASYEAIRCVLSALNIPESVMTRISNTNSTMGLVEGSWADYEASWSYHPDNGMFIHIVVVND